MAFISVVASALFPLFPSLFSPVADSAEREGMRIRKKEQFCVLCCLSLSRTFFRSHSFAPPPLLHVCLAKIQACSQFGQNRDTSSSPALKNIKSAGPGKKNHSSLLRCKMVLPPSPSSFSSPNRSHKSFWGWRAEREAAAAAAVSRRRFYNIQQGTSRNKEEKGDKKLTGGGGGGGGQSSSGASAGREKGEGEIIITTK